MKLRCQGKGINCPPFKHNGIFHPDNESIKRLLPDLNRCADCMAYTAPTLSSFEMICYRSPLSHSLKKDPPSIRHMKAVQVSEPLSVRVSVLALQTQDEKNLTIMGVKDFNRSERPICITQQMPKPTRIWRSC